MTIVRWDPARELDSLQGEMNRLFNGFFGAEGNGSGSSGKVMRRWIPAMDLVEAGDDLVLRADLPGMTEDDIAIEINDNVLTVSGERRAENKEEGETFYRAERAFGAFSRAMTLPDGVSPDAVTARFQDGVLEVRVPKPEERKPHRVRIGSGALEGQATEK